MDDEGVRAVTSSRPLPATRAPIPPRTAINIDPKELMRIQREGRERDEDIFGFYHSHPDHPAQWSQTDLAEAHWFGCSYVITSVEKGKAVTTNSFELTGSGEDDKKLVAREDRGWVIHVGRPPSPAAFDFDFGRLELCWGREV